MRNVFVGILVSIILIIPADVSGRDDFQYWSQYSFKIIDGKNIDWITFADVRFKEDANKLGVHYVSERLKFDYWDHLSLGLNYTYLNSRKTDSQAVDDDYKFHHRLEGEVNPHWNVGDWLKVHLRNRAEFRWIENKGSHNTRLRHRWTLTLPLETNFALQSVYTSGEFFYNIAEHAYDENRMVPLGMRLRLNDKSSWALYYMVQSQKGTDSWASNQILGTLLSITF